MDWRADLEAVLLPVRGETVLYMYRVHPLRASPFSFHMWKRLVCCVGSRAFPVPGYFGTGSPLSLHRIAWYSWYSWGSRYIDRPGLDGAVTCTVTSAPRKTPR